MDKWLDGSVKTMTKFSGNTVAIYCW